MDRKTFLTALACAALGLAFFFFVAFTYPTTFESALAIGAAAALLAANLVGTIRGHRILATMSVAGLAYACAFAVVVAVGLLLDDADSDRRSAREQARATVDAFLSATESRDFDGACGLLSVEAKSDIRHAALSKVSPRGETAGERRIKIRRAFAQARTCPGALCLRAGQIQRDLPTILESARLVSIAPIGPPEGNVLAFGSTQDWVVSRASGEWRIDNANALE